MTFPDFGPEIVPGIELPDVYQISSVDPDLCALYATYALPKVIALGGSTTSDICDRDPVLLDLSDEILRGVIHNTGPFEGPVFAGMAAYNLPCERGSIDHNGLHADITIDTAIVSTSGEADLYLVWTPWEDPSGDSIHKELAFDADGPLLSLSLNGNIIGHTRPVQIVNCIPGTLVRIDQEAANHMFYEADGYMWGLEHGAYDAVGQRIALQFFSDGADWSRYDGTALPRFTSDY